MHRLGIVPHRGKLGAVAQPAFAGCDLRDLTFAITFMWSKIQYGPTQPTIFGF